MLPARRREEAQLAPSSWQRAEHELPPPLPGEVLQGPQFCCVIDEDIEQLWSLGDRPLGDRPLGDTTHHQSHLDIELLTLWMPSSKPVPYPPIIIHITAAWGAGCCRDCPRPYRAQADGSCCLPSPTAAAPPDCGASRAGAVPTPTSFVKVGI